MRALANIACNQGVDSSPGSPFTGRFHFCADVERILSHSERFKESRT